LNRDLLVNWLDWKASESKIRSGALRKEAKDHKRNAAEFLEYAANTWDNAQQQVKSGSNQGADILFSNWGKFKQKAEVEQEKAATSHDEAEDANIKSQFYARKMLDTEFIVSKAASTRVSGQSFQELVDLESTKPVRSAQLRRRRGRLLRAYWKWTKRIVIVILVLLFFGFGMYANITGNYQK
jgi:hypothetical protein